MATVTTRRDRRAAARAAKRAPHGGSADPTSTMNAAPGLAADPRVTRLDLGIAAVLALAAFLLYVPTFSHGFVAYDDDQYVTNNPVVQRGLTPEGVRWAFTTTHFANWLPVTWLSHMLDVSLFGLEGGGHHASSAVLHGANAGLLFLLLCGMTGLRWPSLAAAVLFAVHPLRVESVAWVAERKDVLAATFFLLTLLAYRRYVRAPAAGRYVLVAVMYALGLMSKTMLVTLPFLLLVLDWWPLRRLRSGHAEAPEGARLSVGRLVLEKLPLLGLAMIASAWTVALQGAGGALELGERLTLGQRLANAPVSVVRYIGKTVWPTDLAVFYPHPGSWPTWMVAASVAVVIVITLLAWLVRRRMPYVMVGWLWFLGMLVPVIGVIQAGLQSIADRYTYLPGIGLLIAACWAGFAFIRARRINPTASIAVVGAIAMVLAVLSVSQQRTWATTLTLFRHALRATDENWLAHLKVATELSQAGDVDRAAEHFRESVRINPNYAETWINWGNLLLRQRRYPEATARYRQGIGLRPQYTEGHIGLGTALALEGDYPDAERSFREALRLRPTSALAMVNLAGALRNQGKLPEALAMYRRALAIEPNNPRAQRGVAELQGGVGPTTLPR